MACASSADCAGYNGVCNLDKRCVCHPGWRGATCGQVDFSPGSARRAFNTTAAWTWGGSISEDDEGTIHMFAAEFTNDCGVLHYCSNSRVIHLTAKDPLGPYVHRGVALAPRSPPSWDSGGVSDITVHRLASGTWALYYTGTNNTWDPTNGTHPNCTRKVDPQTGDRASRRIGVATAPTPWGPWARRAAPIFGPAEGAWDYRDVSNPTPLIFANGSVLMLYKGRGRIQAMGAARASAYDGPFTRLQPKAPVLGQAVEDTWAWRQPADAPGGRPEVLHALSHVGNGAHAAGGHAWSLDGVEWHDTTVVHGGGGVAAYTGRVSWADGTTSTLARRERPQILLRRAPAAVRSGDGPGRDADGAPRPAVICTSAQLADPRDCQDGGPADPPACKSFTMCEEVASAER